MGRRQPVWRLSENENAAPICHRTEYATLGAEEQCPCNGEGPFQVDDKRFGLRIWSVASDIPSKGLVTDGGKHWGRRSDLKGYVPAE